MTGLGHAADSAKMIRNLREWRSRIGQDGGEDAASLPVKLTLAEVDALLAAVDERDALNRDACETSDERPANVTPLHVGDGFFLAPVPTEVRERIMAAINEERDAETKADEPDEEDERVIAWQTIASHPFFASCYGQGGTLLDAMTVKLAKAGEVFALVEAYRGYLELPRSVWSRIKVRTSSETPS